MPLKFLSQLKSLPKNQRIALGAGAAGATGLGLYSYRKRKTGATTKPAAATPAGAQSTLTPGSDLSNYAVLVPINWQDGANFGGGGGLTAPLTPGAPVITTPADTAPPAPVVAPPALPAASWVGSVTPAYAAPSAADTAALAGVTGGTPDHPTTTVVSSPENQAAAQRLWDRFTAAGGRVML